MTAIGRGPISAVMSYTTLGWGSNELLSVPTSVGKPIALSGGPVIFELPLSYPDLVFTREWGGNLITGTVGDNVQMVTCAQVVTMFRWLSMLRWWLCSDSDYDQTVIIGSNDHVMDFCQWLMHMVFCWWPYGSQIYFLSSWLAYLEAHSSLWSWHSQHTQKCSNSI